MKHFNRSTWGRYFLSAVMAFAVIIGVMASAAPQTVHAASYLSGVSAKDWMSYISDSTRLSEINIPGTHDSGTRYVDYSTWAQTQNFTIPEQLNKGVRFIDIRLGYRSTSGYTDLLKVVHGTSCDCYESSSGSILYFNKVIGWCHEFLTNHPDETIIMSVKLDGDQKNGPYYFSERVFSYINQNRDWWYLKNGNPTLGEVRGKIVLLRRFSTNVSDPKNNAGLDINFNCPATRANSNQWYVTGNLWSITNINYAVQDFYELGKSDKWNVIKHNLDNNSVRAGSNQYVINFLSSFTILSPKNISDYVNPRIQSYSFSNGTKYGWIIFDHVTETLARKIFETNRRR